MQVETVDISILKNPEKNVRKHPEKQVEEMARSVAMFGQFRPMVVDEDNVVLVGNGLLEAMKRLGRDKADIYRVTGLTEVKKYKLMMADNKVYQLGMDDLENIESIMTYISDFDIPGFDADTLEVLYGDIDMAVDDALSYGTYDEEVVEKKNDFAEKREEQLKTSETVYQESVQDIPSAETAGDDFAGEEKAESRRYVVCPKCGERIWV